MAYTHPEGIWRQLVDEACVRAALLQYELYDFVVLVETGDDLVNGAHDDHAVRLQHTAAGQSTARHPVCRVVVVQIAKLLERLAHRRCVLEHSAPQQIASG